MLAKALPKRVFFSIFTLTLTKAMRQMVFSLFLPYSNQSTATKVFFSLFALILTKALPKMVFFSIICSNANQSYAIKGGLLFFFFGFIQTKELPQRVNFSILILI